MAQPFGRLQDNSLFHASTQLWRKGLLDGVAGVGDQAMVHITPVAFEIRVHAGKRARHRAFSWWASSQPTCTRTVNLNPAEAGTESDLPCGSSITQNAAPATTAG